VKTPGRRPKRVWDYLRNDIERNTMDDVIDLLKAYQYFHGVSDAILGEIACFGTVINYDAAAVVHQLNDPLMSICFILRGRLKAVPWTRAAMSISFRCSSAAISTA
jgi:hypothetical protein